MGKVRNKWYLEKIPKILHLYWGNKVLPYLRYLTLESFCKYNPDWQVRFYYPKHRQDKMSWTTHEQRYDTSKVKDYTSEIKKLPVTIIEIDLSKLGVGSYLSEVHKSDFLRWKLLSTIGGLWADMDIIFFRSMNYMSLNKIEYKEKDTLVCWHQPYRHSIGFMASNPRNEYYSFLWQESFIDFNLKKYQCIGANLVNKYPVYELSKKFPNLFFGNITMDTVYSYNTHLMQELFNGTDLSFYTKNSIGLHWYAGHKLACKFVNEITEKNYKDYSNVLGQTVDIMLKGKG